MSEKRKLQSDYIKISYETNYWNESESEEEKKTEESWENKFWTCKLFHDGYFELHLQERWWRTDRLVTERIQLWLLTSKGRCWCFCWGRRVVVGSSSTNHTGLLTATCKETSLLCQKYKKRKYEQNTNHTESEEGWWVCGLFFLFTPSWIHNRLKFFDGQTDNRVYMSGFMREVCELLNLLTLVENENLGIWCKCVDVAEVTVWVTDSQAH